MVQRRGDESPVPAHDGRGRDEHRGASAGGEQSGPGIEAFSAQLIRVEERLAGRRRAGGAGPGLLRWRRGRRLLSTLLATYAREPFTATATAAGPLPTGITADTAAPCPRPGRRSHPHREGHRPGPLPSRSFAINPAWLAVVMLAVDLVAWTQHLLLHRPAGQDRAEDVALLATARRGSVDARTAPALAANPTLLALGARPCRRVRPTRLAAHSRRLTFHSDTTGGGSYRAEPARRRHPHARRRKRSESPTCMRCTGRAGR